MGYALNYSIPRAVIYNEITDINNSKYDLNRQLIEENKEIIKINKENLFLSINRLLSSKADIKMKRPSQGMLFY